MFAVIRHYHFNPEDGAEIVISCPQWQIEEIRSIGDGLANFQWLWGIHEAIGRRIGRKGP
jgi:hypothetical protein